MEKHTAETEKSRKLYFWVYDFTDVCVYVIIFIPYGYSVNLLHWAYLCIWPVFTYILLKSVHDFSSSQRQSQSQLYLSHVLYMLDIHHNWNYNSLGPTVQQ